MKKTIIGFAALFLSALSARAQAPNKFSYQSVVRGAGGTLVANSTIGVKVSILQGSSTGAVVYSETHTAATNANGLASFAIGGGTVLSGTMASINWASGSYFIKTETDPTGGNNYSIIGTSELLSVPYALQAANGTPGPQGPQGPQGPAGATGPQGPAGPAGATGATGPVGPSGATGSQGPIGLTGPAGPQGATGAAGATGPQGPIGLTGPAGPAGPQGPMGPAGPAGGLNITGSSGQTIRHDGTGFVATSNLFNSGTNVGIGTTNPVNQLHVHNSAGATAVTIGGNPQNGSFTSLVQGTSANTNGFNYIQSIKTSGAGLPGYGVLALNEAGGNVGIGTSTPSAKLEVAGQVKITGGAPAAGKVLTSDANGLATWETPAGGNGNLPTGTSGQTLRHDGVSYVSNSNFTNDGTKIGVGTSTPSGTMHIVTPSSDGNVSAWSNGQVVIGQAGPAGSGLGISYSNTNGAVYLSALTPGITWRNMVTRAFHHVFMNGDLERMRLTNDGNLGVGTGAPTAKLEVAGQVKITGGAPGAGKILTSDANGLASWATLPAGNLPNGTSGQTLRHDGTSFVASSNLYNDGTRVGIGTSSPLTDATLQVFNPGNGTKIYVGGQAAGSTQFVVGTSLAAGGVSTLQSVKSSGSSWGDIVMNNQGGNVMVGPGIPTKKLEVNGTGGFRASSTNTSVQDYNDWIAGNFGGTVGDRVVMGRGAGKATLGGHVNDLSGWADLVINPTTQGNVGIGTTAPTAKLSVNGAANNTAGAWGVFSDARVKTVTSEFTDGLGVIRKIHPVKFRYNADAPYPSKDEQIGIIAQELEKIAPYMVSIKGNEKIKDLREVNNQAYVFLLINAVKELGAEVDRLKTENGDLKASFGRFQAQLDLLAEKIDNAGSTSQARK